MSAAGGQGRVMRRPAQSNSQAAAEPPMETLRCRSQRLKLWQWFGLALAGVPFACLVLYELAFERTGAWSYWLILFAFIGFVITFAAKRKERRLLLDFLSDTGGEDEGASDQSENKQG